MWEQRGLSRAGVVTSMWGWGGPRESRCWDWASRRSESWAGGVGPRGNPHSVEASEERRAEWEELGHRVPAVPRAGAGAGRG